MTTSKHIETDAPEIVESHKSVAEQVSELAERAVIVPLGASLIARDEVSSALRKLHQRYGTTAGLEKELARCEKRGARALKSSLQRHKV